MEPASVEDQTAKSEIVSKLQILADEPDDESGLFGFDKYSKQLFGLIVASIPEKQPFAICLNGEWGEGKTSLLRHVYKNLEERKSVDKQFRVIWFDAWQYERLDPVMSLLQIIINEYKDNKTQKLKDFLKSSLTLASDLTSRAVFDMTSDELIKKFETSVKEINTLSNTLDEIIGDGKLVIFIDDLDRCAIDKIIDMLEAIKILFNAKKARFVVGVDLRKLETAWDMKHKGLGASSEGKAHLEKIFQLKLSLPPKDDASMRQYLETLPSKLSEEYRTLIVKAFPPNIRKIKRALNLAYFIARNMDEHKFKTRFQFVLIWSAIVTSFPDLAKTVRQNPDTFVDLCKMARATTDTEQLRSYYLQVDTPNPGRRDKPQPNIYELCNIPDAGYKQSADQFMRTLTNDKATFMFLKGIADYLNIQQKDKHQAITSDLRYVINFSGLIS